MQIIPHRDNMLLLDEAQAADGKAHGKLRITGDEWFLKGHFPGNPVVPGVILCEILAQSACVLLADAAQAALDSALAKQTAAKAAVEQAKTNVANAEINAENAKVRAGEAKDQADILAGEVVNVATGSVKSPDPDDPNPPVDPDPDPEPTEDPSEEDPTEEGGGE